MPLVERIPGQDLDIGPFLTGLATKHHDATSWSLAPKNFRGPPARIHQFCCGCLAGLCFHQSEFPSFLDDNVGFKPLSITVEIQTAVFPSIKIGA